MRWRLLLLVLILLAILGQPLLTPGRGSGRLILGQDHRLHGSQRIDGDLAVLGGDLTLEPGSVVHGSVLVLGGAIESSGRIEGRAAAASGRIRLGPSAVVTGDVTAAGGVQRDPQAAVGGRVRSGAAAGLWFGWPWHLSASPPVWLVQALLAVLAGVALGLLIALIFPGPLRTTAAAVAGHPVQCLSAGLLGTLAAALAAPLFAVTLLGIPLAILIALALLAAGVYGWVATGLALGERLLLAGGTWRREPTLPVAVGLAVLSLLLSVPCLAIPAALLAGAWGLGAVLLTRFGAVPFTGAPPQVAPK